MQLTCASKGPASSYRKRLAWCIARGKWLACSLITHMSASWDPLTAEVRVQELAQCLNMGALPSSVVVLLQDELVDRCKAGGVDTAAQHNAAELMPCCAAALHCSCAPALELRSCTVESSCCSSAHVRSSASLPNNPADVVEVTGIIHRRWHQAKPGLRCSVELVVVAADLHVSCVGAVTVRAHVSTTARTTYSSCFESCPPSECASPYGVRAMSLPVLHWAVLLQCQVTLGRLGHLMQVCSQHAGVPHHERATEEQFLSFWQQHTGCALRGRDQIVAAMCPQIHGLALVKLATLLMLVGGEQRHDDGGAHVRGEVGHRDCYTAEVHLARLSLDMLVTSNLNKRSCLPLAVFFSIGRGACPHFWNLC